ncbi:MAG: hypothetical protein KAG99_11445 [Bacteroidales bacterium]|nr:hypothetical protein [Bacteroidales bacterium]
MTQRKLLITAVLSIVCTILFAQVPQSFNYQAVARYSDGGLIMDQNIGVRIGILQGSPVDTSLYIETHSPTTNQYGLFSLVIGFGAPVNGTFASIDWAAGPYYLQIEVDETGGTNFQVMDTCQLLSVPFALYSGSTGDTSRWVKNNDTLYYNNGFVGIGTSSPGAKLDVAGNIKASGYLQLGTSAGISINDTCTAAEAGTIIFNGTNFCACDGTTWKQVD